MEKRITFTPGPWRVTEDLLNDFPAIVDAKGERVAVQPLICPQSKPVKRANARLIAAAPDLLAATEAWVAAMKGWLDGNPPKSPEESRAIYDAAVAALRKARGEA